LAGDNGKNYTLRFILRLFAYLSFGLLLLGMVGVVIISLTEPWRTELIWMRARSIFLVLTVTMLLPAFVGGVAVGFISERRIEKWLFWGLCTAMVMGLLGVWWRWH
jgi:hypothetical protein